MPAEKHYINCTQLKNPAAIYSNILYSFYNLRLKGSSNSLTELNERLLSNNKKVKLRILIMDEMDYLLNRNQEVLYNIF